MKIFRLAKLGFTMIELLIVIAVLGILAVAVLSAINPIEQINRGRDTGSRSDAEQLISAIDRFYANKGYYPWMINGDSTNTWTDPAQLAKGAGNLFKLDAADIQVGVDVQEMLQNLTIGGTAEIKDSFVSRITSATAPNYLSIFNSGKSGESTYACFVPKSGAFREEAWKRCTETPDAGVTYTLNTKLPTDFPADACPDTDCATVTKSSDATSCNICLP